MKKEIIYLAVSSLILISCANKQPLVKSDPNPFVDMHTPKDAKPVFAANTMYSDKKWKLAFSDEFEGTSINSKKWNVMDEDKGAKHGIHRYFKLHNVELKNGALVIKYQHEGDTTYTSGKISSKGLFAMQYGYYECKMQAVKTNGHQMAFWMMPENGITPNGKIDGMANDGAEIDIVETCKRTNKYSLGLHWDGYGKEHKSNGSLVDAPNLHDNGMNVYGLEWTPTFLKFYFNGNVIRTINKLDLIPHVKEHILLSGCCFAGGWTDGDIRENKLLPEYSKVEYIRVYMIEH